jgi:hypothetical protein
MPNKKQFRPGEEVLTLSGDLFEFRWDYIYEENVKGFPFDHIETRGIEYKFTFVQSDGCTLHDIEKFKTLLQKRGSVKLKIIMEKT